MKKIIIIVCVVIMMGLFSFFKLKEFNSLKMSLPPSEYIELYQIQEMLIGGADLAAVLGTGSMQPYIPVGHDIVAYVEFGEESFEDLEVGDLVCYQSGGKLILHQLISQDGNDGWIASGLHNRESDKNSVTENNFRGKVIKTFIIRK